MKWLFLLIGLLAFLYLGRMNDIVKRFAEAIARQEGFYVKGSRAQRNNNPGNVRKDLVGKAIRFDGGFPVYAKIADGWENLYRQVRYFYRGSKIYNPSMTIEEIAQRYTTTEQKEWAANVAAYLGVTVRTKASELVAYL